MREARVTVGDAAFDRMGIAALVSCCREAGLRDLDELACRGTGAVVQVTVTSPIDEQRLSSLECVDWWERVTDSGPGSEPGSRSSSEPSSVPASGARSDLDSDTATESNADAHRYVISFTAPALPDGLADRTDDLIGDCDPDVSERETTISLVGPQETIADTVDEYRDAGIALELRTLGAYDGRPGPLDELTDRQREVVETAFELGYYDVPRAASTEDVAAELAIDPSTIAEHLQRAERNLLSYHL